MEFRKDMERFEIRVGQYDENDCMINSPIIAQFEESYMFLEQNRDARYHKIALNNEELVKVIKSFLIVLLERGKSNE